ncbi:MAG: family 43 glycosylhydrolase [Bacillales bacterium]|nr:family 43 glycosylhydrolase [Bacillales bacterium]
MKNISKIIVSLPLFALLLIGCNNNPSSQVSSSESSEPEIIEAKNNYYSNPTVPILNGEKKITYMADPFTFRDDDGYFYLYCTQTEVWLNETTRSFKRGPTYKSIDAVNWEYIGDVFNNYVIDWGTSGAGVWAPTLIKVADKYNFYYSLSTGGDSNPGIGVAVGDTPNGPWTHYGKLFNSNEIGVKNSIDPYAFYDNNQLYLVWGSYGGLITIVELADDGLSLKNGLEYQREHKVAIAGYAIQESNNYEGTIIEKIDDYYYLFLSTGTCCSGASSSYRVVVAKSNNLFGPYTDSKGRDMFRPKSGDYVVNPSVGGVMGVGHNGLFRDDLNQLWMIYHGYDTTGVFPDYRITYLDKLIINKETGMPEVKDKLASNHQILPGPYIKILEE